MTLFEIQRSGVIFKLHYAVKLAGKICMSELQGLGMATYNN